MHSAESARQWAKEMFGGAALGDCRRTRRVVEMATTAVRAGGGRVSSVFKVAREQQAAYDLLEHAHVEPEALIDAVGHAVARKAGAKPHVIVAVDGSSVSLVDHEGKKGFGIVGTAGKGAAGLKVITGLAVDAQGAPLGVMAQRWWARKPVVGRSRAQKSKENAARPVKEKETQRWLDVIDDVRRRSQQHGCRAWVQIDREGDAWPMLTALSQTGLLFTVRSSWNRRLWTGSGERFYLADELARCPVTAVFDLCVPARPHRKGRTARMQVRAMTAELRLKNRVTKTASKVSVTVVEARESGTTPRGESPLHWRLLTNYQVETDRDLHEVIRGYAQRWRIEEFHRTWKSGACDIESTQLRSAPAVIKWATILGAVASRIERLKQLARTQPELTAAQELSSFEIRALILLKRREAKRTEKIGDEVPDVGTAVRWIAELGGYTGKSSGGPPGATTIARGFDRVAVGAAILEAQAMGDE
jgi:Transposase DNA-binding/Transposase Tn5 dimerisation domain